MTVIWMSIHDLPGKKYNHQNLREKKMSLESATIEIITSLEKLKYGIFLIREHSISLLKYDPKEGPDMFLITAVGEPEEIRAIQLDPRIRKFNR